MAKINESYFKMENDKQATKVEDVLDKNETVLLRLKPNKKAYIWSSILKMMPLALLWAAFDITFIVLMAKEGESMGPGLWFMIPFFLLHLAPVWIWLGQIITSAIGYKNIEYVFTEKRIVIKTGIIGIDFKSVFYSEIEGIKVNVGLIEKLFKVGDIYFQSFKQSTILHDVSNPYFLLNKLQKITLDIKTDINYPNDLRPSENHGYNTKYVQDSTQTNSENK